MILIFHVLLSDHSVLSLWFPYFFPPKDHGFASLAIQPSPRGLTLAILSSTLDGLASHPPAAPILQSPALNWSSYHLPRYLLRLLENISPNLLEPPLPATVPFLYSLLLQKLLIKELSYTQYFHLLSSHSLLILLQLDSLPHHFRETTFLRPPVISTLPNPMVSSQVLLYCTSQHSTQVITPSFLTNSSFHF